ncbi:hypothetical protein CW714_06515 [Methanophagales archaeon]|nr:MAG: hypothetical protein CW714_06515 [Methanophagales archaeon]
MKQIGAIHTPYKRTKEVPYQSSSSEEVCEIEVFMEYGSGLKDTDIRPYAPEFDEKPKKEKAGVKVGWLEGRIKR